MRKERRLCKWRCHLACVSISIPGLARHYHSPHGSETLALNNSEFVAPGTTTTCFTILLAG